MKTPDEAPKARKTMRLAWRLLFCLLFYGSAGYFQWQGDAILAAICAVAGMGAFSGYRAGGFSIVTMLVAFTAAIALAPSIGVTHEGSFQQWFGTTGLTNRFLSIGVTGTVVAMVTTIMLVKIGRRLMKDRPRLESANRWIGFGIGALEGTIAIVFFLGGMLMIEPIELKRADLRDPADTRGRLVSKLVLTTAEKTRQSRVGPLLVQHNPFSKIPQLNRIEEVQKSVQVLSEPEKIHGLLQHPSMRRLRQRPEVREAVEKLTSDPEIKPILESRGKMDRSMAMTLLSHPALMELIDQPGFMEEATKVIGETNLFRP